MGLGMRLLLLRPRRNRCAPLWKRYILYIGVEAKYVKRTSIDRHYCIIPLFAEYRMELKTQALDRVLEALSPALAKELERVVQETHDELEQEFQQRLQSVAREAQSAAHREAEAELQRRIAETRDATRKQVTEEVEERFKKTLEEHTNKIQAETAAERRTLEEELGKWRVFVQAQRQFGEASTQAEILARFMKFAEPFAGGLAVYVARADGLSLWKSRGGGAFPETISEGNTDPESYFRTVVVRGKVVAAVFASAPCKMEIIDFLVSSVEQAIEIFGLRLKTPLSKAVTLPKFDGADDEKSHVDARRTARLLISEIKLYNEEELKAGRENHDIYRRLQKEIEHGRETYSQRVSGKILSSRDYFHEELIRILGDNDETRMGAAYPGPHVQ
jgi:hypothetical protein